MFFSVFQWRYIPGWNLTSSVTFRHSSLHCALVLQLLLPTRATSSFNSSHHHKFGLPLFSICSSSRFSKKHFPCRVTFVHPHHMPSPSKSTKLNKFHNIMLIKSVYISHLLRLLQRQFSSIGPNTFRRTILSKDLRNFSSCLR
jgi:hypothetical protein